MRLSSKLNSKIKDFALAIINFSKKVDEVGDSIKNLNATVKEGDKLIASDSKRIDKALRKFNKVKNYCKNFSEEASEIADTSEDINTEIESSVASTPEDQAEVAKFSRKFRILAKRFSEVANNLQEITTAAESVVNMDPEDAVKANKEKVTTGAESIDNKDGEAPKGPEVTVQDKDVQTPATSVNFSYNNYIAFTANTIYKSFAEVVDEVKESADDAKELDEKIETQPEIQPAEGKTEEAPTTEKAEESKVESKEEAKEDTTAEAEKKAEEILQFGKDAIMENDQEKKEELKEKIEDLEDEVPGKGEEVMSKLENFAKVYNRTKNFGTEETPKEGSEAANTMSELEQSADEVLQFGEEALMEGADKVSDEITQKLNDLEDKTPGKGEEVLQKLENFSRAIRKYKNFCNQSVFCKIKQFADEAFKAAAEKKIDSSDLGAKAEDLEKNQPGAGEALTSILESFAKAINAIKVSCAPDAPVKPEDCAKNFCGDIEKFADDIKIADKKFCRELKMKCFALEDAIEDNDPEKIKEASKDLANTIDQSDEPAVVDFGHKLVKFAEDYSKATPKADEAAGVPENVSKADGELNQVLDKLSENGEHLKPEINTFAKKLCSAYKMVKCFTEEDLNAKLTAVEDLKKSFDEEAKPAETPVASEPAPAQEEVTESKLVLEDEPAKSELPSDASIQNFSVVSDDSGLSHLAALEIR